jgi:hypothetical protein
LGSIVPYNNYEAIIMFAYSLLSNAAGLKLHLFVCGKLIGTFCLLLVVRSVYPLQFKICYQLVIKKDEMPINFPSSFRCQKVCRKSETIQ